MITEKQLHHVTRAINEQVASYARQGIPWAMDAGKLQTMIEAAEAAHPAGDATTLLLALESGINRQAQRMDDPRGDGSGDDARSPTGDDYNRLFDAVAGTLNAILHAA
jgi:hypothetical protein